MATKRWQDWLLILGGIWLFIAPWALDIAGDSASSWNAWTVGVLAVVTAIWALARPTDRAAEWLQGLYGVWLFIAPWLLGFAGVAAAAWNAWLVGVGFVVLAWWALAQQTPEPRQVTRHQDMAHSSG